MNPLVIPYPEIDPVLVRLGALAIRWYALAYIAGLGRPSIQALGRPAERRLGRDEVAGAGTPLRLDPRL